MIRLNPTHLAALNNLGVRLAERGDYSEAKEDLGRAYGLEPGRAKTSYNLGYLYERQGKFSEAAKWYGRAVALDGDYPLAKTALDRVTRADRR